jgi:hypothetical protein
MEEGTTPNQQVVRFGFNVWRKARLKRTSKLATIPDEVIQRRNYEAA